ncbi:Por secretion system C-terminal sorting domain-containing protein [Chitinophaga rupis]|uniref:Por secretion system C-terminal sorting domain-containing protein n=1 Tax=Chitinophaga rupis TaxID=573321 RepID=A0A1H7SY99_9BACT|nr:T9SS type A sorting domain-containing protein [Chitinophaga rupis]SEL77438.1 Por secretion system C-terminal sorting domain-containing protein [Chitinophaga rupis]
MKKHLYLLLSILLVTTTVLHAQNAQQLYFNQLSTDFDYQAASFVVDTPPSPTAAPRAFLLWSKNFVKDPAIRGLTLDEFDAAGNFLSEHFNPQPQVPTESILPKKIIRARLAKGYYLLAYVIKSIKTINGIQVYSTPLVIRLDPNLNPVWVAKLHYSTVTTANAQAIIEYNDIIESVNSDVVLAGRYADAPGKQTSVLLTRLSQTGAMIWTFHYPLSVCNAEALSLTELTDRNLAITGYQESCSGGPSGPRTLLYATFNAVGTPAVAERLLGGQALSGSKIVKHTTIAGADELFITGYIDLISPTGAINKQVLLVDIKESGGLITINHIGDAGQEAASDLVVEGVPGGNSFNLYFTGYTDSYATTLKTDAFFLWVKYVNHIPNLVSFNTFPTSISNYVAMKGVELKWAGKERFAILANTQMTFGTQLQTNTHVFIRELNDFTGNCVKSYQPPVTAYQLIVQPVTPATVRLPFAPYRDEYTPFNKVQPRPECGAFKVDPYNANNLRTAGQPLSSVPAVKGPATIRVYPNPVNDQLYIDYGAPKNKGRITAGIYSTDMRLIRTFVLPGGNRNSISLQGLSSGLYFLQLQHQGATQVFEIRKE